MLINIRYDGFSFGFVTQVIKESAQVERQVRVYVFAFSQLQDQFPEQMVRLVVAAKLLEFG